MSTATILSPYRQTRRLIRRLERAVARKDTALGRALTALIESGRYLMIGAQAVIHYTRPRFTDDTDFAVDVRAFRRIRKWLRDHKDVLSWRDTGDALQCDVLGIDVLNATPHPVLAAVLKKERGIPSPEGLAAFKYVAMTSKTRPTPDRIQDAADLARLVLLPAFADAKLLEHLVGSYEELRPEVERYIAAIRAGRPIRI